MQRSHKSKCQVFGEKVKWNEIYVINEAKSEKYGNVI